MAAAAIAQRSAENRSVFIVHKPVVSDTIATPIGFAVVGHRGTVGGSSECGFADQHRTGNETQFVVATAAAGCGCVGSGVFFCARGAHAGQRSRRITAHQATGSEATDGLVDTAVGQRPTVGCDRRTGFGNVQSARQCAHVVVGFGACDHLVGVSACILACGTCCCHRPQVAHCVTALQARYGEPADRLVGAVIGHRRAVARGRECCFIDQHRPANEAQKVVAGAQPAGNECVVTGVDSALRSATVGQRAGEDRSTITVEKSAIGDPGTTAVSLGVVSLAGVIGRDGQLCLTDKKRAVGIADSVVVS